jgi:WD40 repeat protein
MADSLPVILLAFANEQEGQRYLRNLPEELRLLRKTLGMGERGGRFRLELLPNATFDEIKKALRDNRDRVAIFHYGGHAGPDRLLLESESGLSRAVHAEGLAKLLGQQSGLKTVFLNGCSTRAQVNGLLKAAVPSVIATAREIDDSMARLFAESFYAELASGANLRAAFEAAKASVTAAHGADPDLFRSGERRDLGVESREEVADVEGFPWDLHHRTEADQVLRWNLFLDDPMHGLPDLPEDILPPAEPFRRLYRFEREHALVFFGRGQEVRELYDLLVTPKTYPVVLYHGPTGVGKSSILEAGLLPRLERDYKVIALRRDPDLGLLGTLRAGLAVEGQTGADLRAAWKRLEDEPDKRSLVVILDQAEEAFTRPHLARPAGVAETEVLCQSWIDPQREVRELVEALKAVFGTSAQRPRGKLILGFRMEWLQPFQEAFRAATLGFEPMALGPLERAGIVEAIEGPAKAPWLRGRYSLEIANEPRQSSLAEVVAADLQADAGSAVAPTLQVLLGALWDEAKRVRSARPCFDRPLYARLRKAGILLRDFLEQQLKALAETHPESAESGFAIDLLEYHTTPLGTAEGHSRDDLAKRYPHRSRDMESVLDRLKELYLLIESPESPGGTRLAHDTLAPLVRVRVAQSLAPALRGRRILEKRVVEWHDGKQGPVLDRADLAIVEQALIGMRTLTDDENRLLDASRAVEAQRQSDDIERQRKSSQDEQARLDAERKAKEATEQRLKDQEAFNKKLIRVLAGLVAVVIIAIGAGIYAHIERREAQRQAWHSDAQRLAALSMSERLGRTPHPQRSFLLAVEAVRKCLDHGQAVVPSAEQALYDSFDAVQGRFLANHGAPIRALACSVDGRMVTLGADGKALIWDLQGIQSAPILIPTLDGRTKALAFAPNGQLIILDGEAKLRFHDLKTKKNKAITLRGLDKQIIAMACLPDEMTLATIDNRHSMRWWDLAREQELPPAPGAKSKWDVESFAFAPDGQTFTVGWKGIDAWNVPKTSINRSYSLQGHDGAITCIAVARDGRLITGATDGTARSWDLNNLTALPILGGQVGGIPQAFDPSGHLITGDGSFLIWDSRIGQWDLKTRVGKPMALPNLKAPVRRLLFAPDPDGRLVTVTGDDDVRIWDSGTSRVTPIFVRVESKGPIDALTFAPDGRLILGGRDGWVWACNPKNGKVSPLTHIDEVGEVYDKRALAVGPSGHLVIRTNDKAFVFPPKVNDSQPTVLRVLSYTSVLFSPDGRLVTLGDDGTIQLRDVNDLQATPVILRSTQEGGLGTMMFAPDGRLLTFNMDGGVQIWDLDTKRLVDRAASVVGRNLTGEEWVKFVGTGIDEYRRTFDGLPEGTGVAEMRKASAAGPTTNGSTAASTPKAASAVTK